MSRAETQRRYRQSVKGKIALRCFKQSKVGKAARKRYRQSKAGKIAKLRQLQHYKMTIRGCLKTIFRGIRQRCNNSKWRYYEYYGGRGIKCIFQSSDEFVNYVINNLKVDPRGLEIDRIDNDRNYEPGNIRFVSHSENMKNRRKKVK